MSLQHKKVLVTGGSGFIGTNLILRLKAQEADVLNVSRGPPQVECRTIQKDLQDGDFSFLDEGFDYVFHLAALSNPQLCENRDLAFENNVNMTHKFFSALQRHPKIKKIVFMSSIVVYSDSAPTPIKEDSELNIYHNSYTFTKGIDEEICEYYARLHKMPILVFRISNIYGPYYNLSKKMTLMPQIIKQAITEKKIEVWNPIPIRDWIYADDVIDAILLAVETDKTGTYNLGTGIGTSVGDIAKKIGKTTDVPVKFLDKPATGPLNVICDITKAKKAFGWKPSTNIDIGIKKTITFYKQKLTGG